jgi:hypothetical protein
VLPKEQLDRISQLSRKQRSVGLTEEEKAEQHQLRQLYLARFRESFRQQLEARLAKPNQQNGCSCGCHSHHHHPHRQKH